MKVVTVIGTRPEIIRLSRVMYVLDQHCEHIIVHTGQNYDYELNQIFFDDLEIRKPDIFLEAAGKNACHTIGNIISKVDDILIEHKPDALLVLGDTNSCLAAYPAKRQKIPIFHMEAGNRCFDQRVPEEINRKIVDHIADINLTYSTISREYLLREGIPPDRIIKTGSPMREVLEYYLPKINNSDILDRLQLTPFTYYIVSCHREENIDNSNQFDKFINLLQNLSQKKQTKIIVTTHPRTRNRIIENNITFNDNVILSKPFGFLDFVKLQINSKAVLSDSGTITEESSILNFPALNIRDAHERPEGMEEASVIMTGLNYDVIENSLTILDTQKRCNERNLFLVDDYSKTNVSLKVIRIIMSYTNYVKRTVWFKINENNNSN